MEKRFESGWVFRVEERVGSSPNSGPNPGPNPGPKLFSTKMFLINPIRAGLESDFVSS